MPRLSKREQVLRAGLELFLKEGFYAVSVDSIALKAGVTKKTLYNHFKSKEELILAVLRYKDEKFRNQFMRSVESKTKDPEGRLLALFDVAEEWFQEKDFYGCLFVGAIHEFPDPSTPIRTMCREAKSLMLDYIRTLVKAAGIDPPDLLANQLLLLLEGAITMAQADQDPGYAVQAKKAARVLVESSLRAAEE